MTEPIEKPDPKGTAAPLSKPRRAIPPIPPPKAPRPAPDPKTGAGADTAPDRPADKPKPDPTRFGDWEKNGRCIDF